MSILLCTTVLLTRTKWGELMESVQSMIKASSMEEVKKVTGAKVKEAVGKMRPLKADVSGGFTSDALLNALIFCLIIWQQYTGAG